MTLFSMLEASGFVPPKQITGTAAKYDFAIKVWAMALDDLTDEDLATAAAHHVQTTSNRFWPVPGELRALVRSDPSGEEVFDSYTDGLWRRGPVVEETPRIKIGLRAVGGSAALRLIYEKDIPFARRAFAKAYDRATTVALVDRKRVACREMKLIEDHAK